MAKITLSIRKTLEQSAQAYFEAAKKARRKREGALRTIERITQSLPQEAEAAAPQNSSPSEWYERFRWSFTSDGALLVGGRDASTNEVLLKRHVEQTDTVFHTQAPASPFLLLKAPRDESKIHQAALLCAAYSAAWKGGLASTEVFWVLPSQVTKQAQAGEYLARGAFMVRGEKNFVKVPVTISLGLRDGKPCAGSQELFESVGGVYAVLVPGKDKPSDIAAKIAKKLGFTVDAWLRLLPAGGCQLTGWKRSASAIPPRAKSTEL